MQEQWHSGRDSVGGRVAVRQCGPCERNSLTKIAIAHCTECTMSLCEQCTIGHLSDNSKQHTIVNSKTSGCASEATCFNMNGMDKCIEHKKYIEFYCENHEQFCCSGCVMKHRNCDKFNELNYFVERDGQECDSILLNAGSDVNVMVQQLKQLVDELNGETRIVTEINDMRERILEKFDDAKTKLLHEANNIAEIQVLNERCEKVMSAQKKISKISTVSVDVSTTGTPKQRLIVAKSVKNIRNDVENLKREFPRRIPYDIRITFSDHVNSLVDTLDSEIGKLLVDDKLFLRDPFSPKHIAEQFSKLYENEWTDAYEDLKPKMRSEPATTDVLLDIVMKAYQFSEQELNEVWDYARKWFVDENEKPGQRLAKHMLDARKRKVMIHASEIKTKFTGYLRSHERLSGLLVTSEMDDYITACIDVCLLMTANTPPLVLECPGWKTNSNKQKQVEKQIFNTDLYKAYFAMGPYMDYYVWPALRKHQSGPLLHKGVAQGCK